MKILHYFGIYTRRELDAELKQLYDHIGALEHELNPQPRICARCNDQIKRDEHWTAKGWEDQRPRHWDCERRKTADFFATQSNEERSPSLAGDGPKLSPETPEIVDAEIG